MNDGNEEAARFRDLVRGPWARGAWRAFRHLRPSADLSVLAYSDKLLRLTDVQQQLVRNDLLRQQRLRWVFRFHGESPIRDQYEIRLRDSLDRILETLTLIEIAAETEYLSLSNIRSALRRFLLDVLWCDGVRNFITNYGYISVPLLSSRLELEFGLREVGALPAFGGAEMRFATFLAQHQWWYRDSVLCAWLRFLDDYSAYPEERHDFAQFLKEGDPSGGKEHNERFVTLLAGLERFCTYLSTLAGVLRENETEHFFVIYLYMMARFVGNRMTLSGFEKNRGEFDWSEHLLSSPFATSGRGLGEDSLRIACKMVVSLWERTAELVAAKSLQRRPAIFDPKLPRIEILIEVMDVSSHLKSVYADELANILLTNIPGVDVDPLVPSWRPPVSNPGLRVKIAPSELNSAADEIDKWRFRKVRTPLKLTSRDGSRSVIVEGSANLRQAIDSLN